MKIRSLSLAILFGLTLSLGVQAQVPVQANTDHAQMLAAADPVAAANKRLVYDFWREVFEGGQLDQAGKYLTEGYIQHNPSVPTGREGFVKFFAQFSKPKPLEARIKAPLVAVLAEGDKVVLVFVQTLPEPEAPGKTYTSTWFDMFRIEGGKIAEHWDPATKR
ncbi:nuclear transport factor 2 family protein [Paucibacter sp. Y2R2-4]|uniref:nuclear transport factor 2 family protein n=1 Tax=Paucibacter sp. Y2R2-4 TaxID=2893553 RepID=UPI0021E3DDA7|nr:nuclear transport factor 2 family protein [Paucibacter sp. Y2R2-4]MCV2348662.1 nuclear transport factor 2 family protein [Paucibacter sp. Y2R2-4]